MLVADNCCRSNMQNVWKQGKMNGSPKMYNYTYKTRNLQKKIKDSRDTSGDAYLDTQINMRNIL